MQTAAQIYLVEYLPWMCSCLQKYNDSGDVFSGLEPWLSCHLHCYHHHAHAKRAKKRHNAHI